MRSPPPSRADAYLHIRREEIYLENLDLFEQIWDRTMDELRSELQEVTRHALGLVPYQRASLLDAHLTQRERENGIQNGRAHLRERLILHLWRKLGWRWTESEAEQLITILGGAADGEDE